MNFEATLISNFLLAAVQDEKWHWGLGDPDLGAVLVTALYLMTSLACGLVGRTMRSSTVSAINFPCDPAEAEYSAHAQFWLILSGILLCLGINKQADLQSLLTLFGRDILRELGLYDSRRAIQIGFILILAFAAWCCIILMLWMVRRWSAACRTAAVGLIIQTVFLIMRAASFHHVDRLLGMRLGDIKINLLLESVGLLIILTAAIAHGRRSSVLP